MSARLLVVLGLLVALVSCGRPTFASYDDAAYAGAICTDGSSYRVPDSYCPIGDGDPPPGYLYHWAYRPYRADQRDIDVVYVGYPVDTHVWTYTRPATVPTLNIDRGSYPETEPAGLPRAASARVATEPVRRSTGSATVTRGGLGSTSTPVTAKATAPPPKRIPPPPAGSRPMAAAKAKK